MLKFGEYLPDVSPLENPGLTVARNILPRSAGYATIPRPAQFSTNALDGIPQGGFSGRAMNASLGAIFTVVGTADKLYSFDSTSFTDVSKLGGYNTAEQESWEFAQWGNDVLATNFADPIQTISIGAPPFADLAGTPPQSRHIGVVDNFLVVGNTYDMVDGFKPYRVRWAGIGTTTSWTVSATTQADFQDLRNDAGYIQKVVGGEFGLIFQERAITRMSYIGSPLVFQFDELESQRGALAPNSVIKVGDRVAYLAQDGFFVFDGEQSIPIGDAKIDQTFFDDVQISLLYRMSVAQYPTETIICWSYVSIHAAGSLCDKILFYNYAPNSAQRWTYADIDSYLLLTPISTAYTLDGLDVVSTNLDALPQPPPNDISLDSTYWMGSINLLATINRFFYLAAMNGLPLDVTIETGEAWLEQQNRTYLTMVRPHVDKLIGTLNVQIGTRNLESEDVSYGPACELNRQGYVPVRANARFMRAKFNIDGNFNNAQGFDIIAVTGAGRN